jgi:hypothetical protein
MTSAKPPEHHSAPNPPAGASMDGELVDRPAGTTDMQRNRRPRIPRVLSDPVVTSTVDLPALPR